MGSPVEPTYEEIMERAQALASTARGRVIFEEIGPSEEGRPIPMLRLGDSGRELPLLLVTGGVHGSEEAGRAASMAFAEWLAGEGAAYLEQLSAVVIPCANPDGAERDSYHNARDININRSHRLRAPASTAEGRAMEEAALELLPDCYVDVHGLAGGAMGDSEYVYEGLPLSMGLQIGFAVAAEMDAEAVRAGLPQRHPRNQRYSEQEGASLCHKLVAETNALCFTVEITENYYPLADSVKSGLVRLQKLVEIGTRRQYNQPYPGFPCDTLAGGPMFCLMPFGAGYRKRRKSRLRTMATLREDHSSLNRSYADPQHTAALTLELGPAARTSPEGVVLQLSLDPRAKVTGVRCEWADGEAEELVPTSLDGEHGYHLWRQEGIPMVRATVARPPGPGENRVVVEYDAPFRPHVHPR